MRSVTPPATPGAGAGGVTGHRGSHDASPTTSRSIAAVRTAIAAVDISPAADRIDRSSSSSFK